jgi:uncharacterized protein with GYD domain
MFIGVSRSGGVAERSNARSYDSPAIAIEEEKNQLALYMTQFAYTADAWAALAKNPQDRGQVVAALTEKLGGKFREIYYCFGDYDGLIIFEAPDNATAAAIIVAAIAPGHLKAAKTTPLFTMSDTMALLRKAGTATYQAPKG